MPSSSGRLLPALGSAVPDLLLSGARAVPVVLLSCRRFITQRREREGGARVDAYPAPGTSAYFRASSAEAPPRPPKCGGTYYFAGMPQPSASFSGATLLLTNPGYVVGDSESKRDPVYRLTRFCRCHRKSAPSSRHSRFAAGVCRLSFVPVPVDEG